MQDPSNIHGTRLTRVLVVEDDPSLRTMLRLIFETAGYEVDEAGHGQAALEKIAGAELPDIISTDLMMPVMNGGELIHRLRSDPRTASIPIIVVSANVQSAKAVQGLDQVDAVMPKPFLPAALVSMVRTLEREAYPGGMRAS